MAGFVKGDVVVVPFPYSDLSQSKRRPALVITPLPSGDVVLCQITSQAVTDGDAVPLNISDFTTGSLPKPSNIRANKLFTADAEIILRTAGRVTENKLQDVINRVVEVVRRS